MSVDPDRAKSIFLSAVGNHSPQKWGAYLDEACGDDANLRGRVEILLAAHQRDDRLTERGRAALNASPLMVDSSRVTDEPGTVVGPYKVLQQIGEGGMGVVYMAEQTEPVERRVALKIIKPGMDSRRVIARFEAERQALAMMDHPNIAKVLEAGTTDTGRPYFVMELVKGIPITEYCDEHHLTPRERLELFVPVCQAVQHAHQKGIIHRDIKPSNVMVAEYDDRPVPKIIDFGVAKAIDQRLTEKTVFTQLGQVVGTVDYMSPEQANLSQVDIDTRSDIYSLGVLLYELLSGETPFDRERLRSAAFDELLRIIREEEPPTPSHRLSSSDSLPSIAANRQTEPRKLSALVGGELDWIVMKALEKDRTRRYETASAFETDIHRYLTDEPIEARPPSATYKLRKFARRNRAGLAVFACLFLVFAVFASSIGWIVRDRAVQQAELKSEVNQALFESNNWLNQQQWHRALAAAEKAQSLLASGHGNDELSRQVQERVSVLELVLRLEEIRTESMSRVIGVEFDYAGADREFAEAFHEHGFEPLREPSRQFSQFPEISLELAAALDVWASVRRRVAGDDESSWKRLLEAARANDPDRWRNELRTAWMQDDQDSLAQLVEAASVDELTPPTIHLLCVALPRNKQQHAAVALLRDAVRTYPDDFWINWHLGEYAFLMGDYSASVRYYTAARALRPDNPGVRNNLGSNLREMGRLDEGIDEYRAAIRLNPADVLARANLGQVYGEQGRFGNAVDAFRESIHQDPQHSPAYSGLVWLLATCRDKAFRDPAQAVEYAKKAIELHVEEPSNWSNLGVAEYRAGHWQAAIDALNRSREMRHNKDPWHAYFLAMAHWQLGNQEDALNNYDEVVTWMLQTEKRRQNEELRRFRDEAEELIPSAASHREVYERARDQLALARSQRSRESFTEAEAAARDAVSLNPRVAVSHDHLGHVLRAYGLHLESETSTDGARAQGKFRDATAEFREAVRLDPNRDGTLHVLGDALFYNLGQIDEAEAAYREAVRVNPDNAGAHIALGDLLNHLEQWTEAESCYRTGIRLNLTVGRFHRSFARSLQDQGRIVEAVDEYSAASRLEPGIFDDYFWIARLLSIAVDREDRDPQRALAAANRAVELAADRYDAWMVLGWARFRTEDWTGSIEALERSCELHETQAGGNEWQWFFLAMAHWQNGNEEEARSWYDRAARYVERVQPDAEEPYQFRDEAEALMPFARPHREAFARAQAQHSLARTLVSEEKFADAEDALREATRLDPENVIYHQFLGDVLHREGKLADAEAVYHEAIWLAPDNAGRWHNFGDILRAQDKLDGAADAYRVAIRLNPSAPSYHHLAVVLARKGEPDQAKEVLREAIRLKPENTELRKFLEEIARKQESGESDQESGFPNQD